jgi:hypothetical protein
VSMTWMHFGSAAALERAVRETGWDVVPADAQSWFWAQIVQWWLWEERSDLLALVAVLTEERNHLRSSLRGLCGAAQAARRALGEG